MTEIIKIIEIRRKMEITNKQNSQWNQRNEDKEQVDKKIPMKCQIWKSKEKKSVTFMTINVVIFHNISTYCWISPQKSHLNKWFSCLPLHFDMIEPCTAVQPNKQCLLSPPFVSCYSPNNFSLLLTQSCYDILISLMMRQCNAFGGVPFCATHT